ncbi:hypothetical protein SD70_05595 [Gordoniibacillus kamchatkensis]|uniref:HTH lysR-type domain-containing protein n=1 Tax=Gordoniibacillus kamchatkensis TaxID=1590651 RepID=A0ABR5AKL9_9BACL|nr:LysR family transcriptional regulator [Paenibacillus sp. VKM B-2647]KIL41610.1 hypothetical protein SD70_05595 [Paenibacillus sp. VKM B-2647]
MHLDYFHGFVEAVQNKSLSKASERLNLTHPALSKQIRKLEQFYGVELLRRSAAGIEPTEAGKLLYERIGPILRDLAALQSDLAAQSGLKRAALGSLPSIAAHYLPPLIVSLERKGVAADVIVKPTSEELIELVRSGSLDAALVDALSPGESLWTKSLFTEPLFAVVPLHHPFASREAIGLEALAREPLVLHPPACSIRTCVTRLLEQRQALPNVRMEVGFGDFLLGYVASGAGLTVVPKLVADRVGHLGLRAIALEDAEAKRTVSLAANSAAVGRAIMRRFAC